MVNYYQFNGVYELFINAGLNNSEIISILEVGQTNDIRVVNNITQDQFNQITSIFRTPAVGASGAIYGILVAYGMTFPNAKLALIFLPVPIAAKYFIPALIALDLFSGLTGFSLFGGGVAHFAHVGGALIGFIIAWYWKQNQFKRWN